MLTTVAVMIALLPSSMDQGALIGLRAQDGSLRTVLVSQRGVAYLAREHKGDVLKSNKMAVLAYRREGEDIVMQGRPYRVGGTFRLAWLANTGLGIEFDASKPGERPYTRVRRMVVGLRNTDEVYGLQLSSIVYERMSKVREAAHGLGGEPSETDWGYVRHEGKWHLVGSVGVGSDRKEFTLTGETLAPTPSNRGEISWREVVSEHPDATDVIASRDAPFAVVVTPTQLIVHEASRTSLGKIVRRMPAESETVVHYEFGGSGPLEAWHRYIKD
jgi:hypothetical protein